MGHAQGSKGQEVGRITCAIKKSIKSIKTSGSSERRTLSVAETIGILPLAATLPLSPLRNSAAAQCTR